MAVQVLPLPVKPSLQVQLGAPPILLPQVALTLQPPLSVAHSLMSEQPSGPSQVPVQVSIVSPEPLRELMEKSLQEAIQAS